LKFIMVETKVRKSSTLKNFIYTFKKYFLARDNW